MLVPLTWGDIGPSTTKGNVKLEKAFYKVTL